MAAAAEAATAAPAAAPAAAPTAAASVSESKKLILSHLNSYFVLHLLFFNRRFCSIANDGGLN